MGNGLGVGRGEGGEWKGGGGGPKSEARVIPVMGLSFCSHEAMYVTQSHALNNKQVSACQTGEI